jgi:hypothetical protein
VTKKYRICGKFSFILRQKQSVLNELLKGIFDSARQEIRHEGYRWGSVYSEVE